MDLSVVNAWAMRNGDLHRLAEYDVGMRLVQPVDAISRPS